MSNMEAQCQLNLSEYLQKELLERCNTNTNYSLRAFARDLSIAPSSLSEIISGKRPVSKNSKLKIGKALGFTDEELSAFKTHNHGNSKNAEEEINSPFKQVSIDAFEIISDWHHYAILELMKLKGFKWDFEWISERLNLTTDQVSKAVQRLERSHFLEKNENGDYVDTTLGFSNDIREGLSSLAQRQFQKKALNNAVKKLQEISVSQRDNTSMTFAFCSDDMESIKKDITKFRRQMALKYEKNKNLNEVYQLTVAFCPLTKIRSKK